ncbi:transposase [Oceanobacillus arenosus]|uniref:Transposase n=1 Tax=Oceanobacillus arenosus TaxID=1229153 RepID=A0A3D8PRP9_9BACI|nr:transposase [Oceanobacillus arenosus]RDW18806.1 transposase [Oceanobacillus arenosus]
MARKRRIWLPDTFYHIISRGNRRDAIFREEVDYNMFLHFLHQVKQKIPFELASYCLMTNHFHLQMRSLDQSISKIMSLLNKRYADYFNNKHGVTGHVFEKRFFDERILTSLSMLKVSRYIHLNPVKAGMVRDPENYQWSSYRQYYHVSDSSLLNPNIVLDSFPGNEKEKRKQYHEFLNMEDDMIQSEQFSITR